MDVQVIDLRPAAHTGMAANTDSAAERGEIGEANNGESRRIEEEEEEGPIPQPYVGMEFHSEKAARKFYEEYARRLGFSSKLGPIKGSDSEGPANAREFMCGKEGAERESCCGALFRVESRGGRWVSTKFVKDHSHALTRNLSPVQHSLRRMRHFSGGAKNVAEAYQGVGIVPGGAIYVNTDGRPAPVEKNRVVRSASSAEANRKVKSIAPVNYVWPPVSRRRSLGKDAQNLLEYFKKMQAENPGFFYAIQLDEDNHMGNVFWADGRSRSAYSNFGDAVTFDTTYRVNRYIVPFAPFTGVNHHGQTVLFGCALLLDELETSFNWLFKTFLTAMNDRRPVSITTDQDRAIQTAVSQVFPEVRHCISKWHVLREGQERLAHVCHTHPNFHVELYNCINLTETIEEFESSWDCILEKYDLRRNDWLQSLYSARAQWVPVYFRDSFFAALAPNQGYEASFFEGYVNQQTPLPLFFRQYERALENWFERELEADFDTIYNTPVLRTPSPMEKQAADLFTRKIFAKFQEELVETFVYTANRIEGDGAISTFRVAKFEDDHKAYTVTLNHPELRANCSCQLFEYSGILCRHVLTVFTVTNVLTLPPHYILKRWTRNAKNEIGLDEHSGELHDQESRTLRYNHLCREALRYAEDGATTVETYNAAMIALLDGGKKVSSVKRSVAKVTPPSSQVAGNGKEDKKNSASNADLTPLLWPRQDEVMRQFNLNDAGAQAQTDFNLPRMAPVSLVREDGTPENMAILRHLKSMTWVMENKDSAPGNRVAVINLKLHDYTRIPLVESEVKFQLSRISLEPMLRSMAYITEQLSTPANKVAVINLKLQDTDTSTGESDIKFQVSRDTLGAMLRSMAYIREQLSTAGDITSESQSKKQRK